MSRIRNRTIAFRVSEKEYAMIKGKIAESNQQQNDFILNCCINKKIMSVKGPPQLAVQVGKIGNNLNQLARKANQGIDIPKEELEEIKRGLDDAWRLLKILAGEQNQ